MIFQSATVFPMWRESEFELPITVGAIALRQWLWRVLPRENPINFNVLPGYWDEWHRRVYTCRAICYCEFRGLRRAQSKTIE